MLTEFRRATADRRAPAVEGKRQSDEWNLALVSRLHDAERRRLRQRLDLAQVVDRRARHADRIEALDPMRARTPPDDILYHRDQHVAVGEAIGIGLKARIARPFGMPELARELGEKAIVGGRDDDLPVRRVEGLEDDHAVAPRRIAYRQVAAGAEAGEVSGEPTERGLEQRGVDHHALAGALALKQAGDAAERGPHSRAHVEQ